MFDFVSTRPTSTPTDQGHAQLIAGVIARMLRDACARPSLKEKQRRANFDLDAIGAMDYFFDPSSSFETHIEAIGGSAYSFRTALLGDHPLPDHSPFDMLDRRVLQLRHRWWCSLLATSANCQKETS